MAWGTEVAFNLRSGAHGIDALKYSEIEFGIFGTAWGSYRETAAYIQERLFEGGLRADEIRTALHKVAANFEGADTAREGDIKKLEGDMDFSL